MICIQWKYYIFSIVCIFDKYLSSFFYRFNFVKKNLVEFNQLAAANCENADDMLNRVMQRDNICIMALLETVEPIPELNNSKAKLVVTNAHIHWDPEYKDVKVIQSVMLMRELKKFMEESNGGYILNNSYILTYLSLIHI